MTNMSDRAPIDTLVAYLVARVVEGHDIIRQFAYFICESTPTEDDLPLIQRSNFEDTASVLDTSNQSER